MFTTCCKSDLGTQAWLNSPSFTVQKHQLLGWEARIVYSLFVLVIFFPLTEPTEWETCLAFTTKGHKPPPKLRSLSGADKHRTPTWVPLWKPASNGDSDSGNNTILDYFILFIFLFFFILFPSGVVPNCRRVLLTVIDGEAPWPWAPPCACAMMPSACPRTSPKRAPTQNMHWHEVVSPLPLLTSPLRKQLFCTSHFHEIPGSTGGKRELSTLIY